jgi:L-asparaginase/Glu-tRNA(Gln) amidotransferase subunit D
MIKKNIFVIHTGGTISILEDAATGAMRSSIEIGSDGLYNFISTTHYASYIVFGNDYTQFSL